MSSLMTIGEVAELLRVRPARAYQLARDGLLPCVRLGTQVRVDPQQLAEWIACGGSRLEERQTLDRPT